MHKDYEYGNSHSNKANQQKIQAAYFKFFLTIFGMQKCEFIMV